MIFDGMLTAVGVAAFLLLGATVASDMKPVIEMRIEVTE